MPVLQRDHASLYYEIHGDGRPLIVLNGTTQDALGWVLQLPWLSERRTVVLLDPRDCGRSGYVDEDYGPAELAEDAVAVLEDAGVGRADVFGYSLGGAIAQELALLRPDLVRRLVLVSTWARTDAWLRWKFRSLIRLSEALTREDFFDVFALDLFTPAWFDNEEIVQLYRAFVSSHPYPQRRDGQIRQFRADIAHAALDRLPGITAPALVVVGEDDVLVPPRYSRELAHALPVAKLESLPGAAHAPFVEQPDALRGSVDAFLDDPSP